jgi:hypothetical protein
MGKRKNNKKGKKDSHFGTQFRFKGLETEGKNDSLEFKALKSARVAAQGRFDDVVEDEEILYIPLECWPSKLVGSEAALPNRQRTKEEEEMEIVLDYMQVRES